MANLENKIAIVTGGASGIGLATVKALIGKGAKVVISDYNEEGGKAVEKELKENGVDVVFIRADVSDEKSVQNLVAETVKKYGRLDIMVNNAGVGTLAVTHELSFEDYNKVISVNQNGVFFGSKYAIREMLKTGEGCIVNTASILGHVGEPGAFAYNASKGAVKLMTKSLALEYASKGIRVNAVCPGYVETGMVNKEALGDFYDGLVTRHPIGRLGRPEEVAHAIVFLCENDFVTGISLLVDGGYTAQ
ncbi:short-chain dehydrogenase [Weizmannia acidilactici]|uniref:Short-chain dehydrogenase n=1 Tax=Weizmannia acidilactici TaxID=2607726 RepID=A0A5J4JDT1_9BACI|nr:SDR family NAD(P)-dependent oxidoreductase [Weizmannia acidilactici]GER67484.1 short-chain dehydrogenase [Weizmannia acidilactici]GER68715.1 short-chain dehydrogenase [Weizmannia acidilactici]GER74239.1 short-chain dehydrogenase [Weizmannia acidilactici]